MNAHVARLFEVEGVYPDSPIVTTLTMTGPSTHIDPAELRAVAESYIKRHRIQHIVLRPHRRTHALFERMTHIQVIAGLVERYHCVHRVDVVADHAERFEIESIHAVLKKCIERDTRTLSLCYTRELPDVAWSSTHTWTHVRQSSWTSFVRSDTVTLYAVHNHIVEGACSPVAYLWNSALRRDWCK